MLCEWLPALPVPLIARPGVSEPVGAFVVTPAYSLLPRPGGVMLDGRPAGHRRDASPGRRSSWEVRMLVSAILARKGSAVFTIAPDVTVATATQRLREHGVGALVVSEDGSVVSGIVSERDVVRCLVDIGPDGLDRPVATVMTGTVVTCAPADSTEQLMEIVTTRRIRHLPVVEDGRLVGLVSIGDIVASRVHELEEEAQLLRDYITAR